MLSKSEIWKINEMTSKKDIYLAFLDTPENQQKLKKAESLYENIDHQRSDYISKVGNEALSKEAYAVALKDKKIDPFVAGGTAQAIGGTALGAYAAIKTSSNNAIIDERRNTYKTMADEDSVVRAVSEDYLRSFIKELDELLNSEIAIKDYRESLLETAYQEAMSLKRNKSYVNAQEAFLSLGTYKDSSSQAKACINTHMAKGIGALALMCALISLFVVLVSGVFIVGIGPALIVFGIAFVISIIVLPIMLLKNH